MVGSLLTRVATCISVIKLMWRGAGFKALPRVEGSLYGLDGGLE